jgi:peroxiredoxin
VADQRPTFRHNPERRGLIGPFSGRQVLLAFATVVVSVVVLVVATTPLGNTAGPPLFEDPQSTPFIIGEPVEGLRVGDVAPDFEIPLGDGSTYQLRDLEGNPIRLSDLRGKAVWINFFASWCPPCQGETPVLREVSERYRDQGLETIAVSVQETTSDDVREYADRYELDFTIGFDGSGHVFREYRVYALPTQFFLDADGVIRYVVQGPLGDEGASQRVEAVLPEPSGTPSQSPSPSPSS